MSLQCVNQLIHDPKLGLLLKVDQNVAAEDRVEGPERRHPSGVKEIAAFGGDVSALVPAPVAKRLAELFPDGRPGTPERPDE